MEIPVAPIGDENDLEEPPTGADTYPTGADVQVRVSVNTNLDDTARGDSVLMLLTDLANAVGDGDASHVPLSVSVVAPKKEADRIGERAQAAGGTASSTELD